MSVGGDVACSVRYLCIKDEEEMKNEQKVKISKVWNEPKTTLLRAARGSTWSTADGWL